MCSRHLCRMLVILRLRWSTYLHSVWDFVHCYGRIYCHVCHYDLSHVFVTDSCWELIMLEIVLLPGTVFIIRFQRNFTSKMVFFRSLKNADFVLKNFVKIPGFCIFLPFQICNIFTKFLCYIVLGVIVSNRNKWSMTTATNYDITNGIINTVKLTIRWCLKCRCLFIDWYKRWQLLNILWRYDESSRSFMAK